MTLQIGKVAVLLGAGQCFLSFSPFRFSAIFVSTQNSWAFFFLEFLISSRNQCFFLGVGVYIVKLKELGILVNPRSWTNTHWNLTIFFVTGMILLTTMCASVMKITAMTLKIKNKTFYYWLKQAGKSLCVAYSNDWIGILIKLKPCNSTDTFYVSKRDVHVFPQLLNYPKKKKKKNPQIVSLEIAIWEGRSGLGIVVVPDIELERNFWTYEVVFGCDVLCFIVMV